MARLAASLAALLTIARQSANTYYDRMAELRPVPRQRLVDVVIDHFRTAVAKGTLAPGSRLPPEGQLTKDLGVSRTTLREAVVVLSHDGLLDVRQGDGTYVATHPPEQCASAQRFEQASDADLLQVRAVLEPLAARLAAERRADADLIPLHLVLSERNRAVDWGQRQRVADHEAEFRTLVARASANDVLTEMLRLVARRIDAPRGDRVQQLADVDPYRALLRAIERRDGDAAELAAKRIVELDRTVAVESPEPAPREVTPAASDTRRGPRVKRATP